ncbi:hypothetical protein FHY52_35610, partial [Nocardia nova]|uniref:MutS-related protein n=1 Tax=Nocardia nova TaxID=37330 RepID=UPI0025B2681C
PRHAVLTDCCAHPQLVRAVHDIAAAATSVRRWTSAARRRANGTLVLTLPPFTAQLEQLRRLRTLLERDGDRLTAAGWTDLIATTKQFDDTYLRAVRDELSVLRFDHGVDIEAGLGAGNKITDVVVHRPPARRPRFGFPRSTSIFEAIADGEAEADPVMQLKDHALAELADVVAATADRLHAFFLRLREETAFYLGCLILRERLDRIAIPYCLPHPHPSNTTRLRCRGLRDITLALGPAPASVAGSDLAADGRSLLIVTGANNGGKSTFLRSLGAAQLMMQAGMFVLAEEFAADVRDGVFTHFVGDEDHTLSYGKLADELVRMNAVIDRIGPRGLLLCNEAFASTGERDAGRIAGPLLRALTEAGVKVVFVTTSTTTPATAMPRRTPATCSCAPNADPTAHAPTASWRARPSPAVTATTCGPPPSSGNRAQAEGRRLLSTRIASDSGIIRPGCSASNPISMYWRISIEGVMQCSAAASRIRSRRSFGSFREVVTMPRSISSPVGGSAGAAAESSNTKPSTTACGSAPGFGSKMCLSVIGSPPMRCIPRAAAGASARPSRSPRCRPTPATAASAASPPVDGQRRCGPTRS